MRAPDPERTVAIVGLGGVFPGAPTPEAFWEMVREGRDAAGEPPPGRWVLSPERAHRPGAPAADAVLSRRACFIHEEPAPDVEGLSLDPALVRALDPTLRLALHASREALRSCIAGPFDRARVGVILGSIALPTEGASRLAWESTGAAIERAVLGDAAPSRERRAHPLERDLPGSVAGLVARALGLGGPAFTLDAACASSLYAVKLACDALLDGRADAMLAGGLARPDSLYTQMGFSQLQALSPSGRCAPFDARGDGLVVGEGAGVLVLARLSDALARGDCILALVRGIGLSNDVDGKLLAPSAEGQLRAMRAAYATAGWDPGDVDHVECHATGTPKGDAVELLSLRALWGEGERRRGACALGTVKSNVGHLLTGAGAAGLVKTLLAMRHETLPPTAHFARGASGLGLERAPSASSRAPSRGRGASRADRAGPP